MLRFARHDSAIYSHLLWHGTTTCEDGRVAAKLAQKYTVNRIITYLMMVFN